MKNASFLFCNSGFRRAHFNMGRIHLPGTFALEPPNICTIDFRII